MQHTSHTQVIFADQKDGILTLHLVKARFGASNKKIQYAFDFDRGIFTYIPSELAMYFPILYQRFDRH